MHQDPPVARVRRLSELNANALLPLVTGVGLRLRRVGSGEAIPGSFWGAPEAGIIGTVLWVRADTPLHSMLHTASHVICMDGARRAALHTDCGGDDVEEGAVCFLQASLADAVPDYGREALWRDMDAWGYSFRLGSAREWHLRDAEEVQAWLRQHGLTDHRGGWTGRLRD